MKSFKGFSLAFLWTSVSIMAASGVRPLFLSGEGAPEGGSFASFGQVTLTDDGDVGFNALFFMLPLLLFRRRLRLKNGVSSSIAAAS